MNTIFVKEYEQPRAWYVIDAAGKPLGRVAAKVAAILRGKNKVTYAKNQNMGDYVVIINADKVAVSGGKEQKKIYYASGETIDKINNLLKHKQQINWDYVLDFSDNSSQKIKSHKYQSFADIHGTILPSAPPKRLRQHTSITKTYTQPTNRAKHHK